MANAIKIAGLLCSLCLSFYAGSQWATNSIYDKLEAYNKANPIEVVRVCAERIHPTIKPKHKTKNPKLMVKGD